jgi:hypothetical protein
MALLVKANQRPPQDENIQDGFLSAQRRAGADSLSASPRDLERNVALRAIQELGSPQRGALAKRLDNISFKAEGGGTSSAKTLSDRFKNRLYNCMLLPEDRTKLPTFYANECANKISAALDENGSFKNPQSQSTLESELKKTLEEAPEDIQEEVKNSCLNNFQKNYPNSSIGSQLSELLDKSMPTLAKKFAKKKKSGELQTAKENLLQISDEDLKMFAHTEHPSCDQANASRCSSEKPIEKDSDRTKVCVVDPHTQKPPHIDDEDLKMFAK